MQGEDHPTPPSGPSQAPSGVSVSWRGRPVDVTITEDVTLDQLKQLLEEKTGVRAANQKLVVKGRALSDSNLVLSTLGTHVKLVLIGSTDADVEEARKVPKLDVRVVDDLTGKAGRRGPKARPISRKYGFGRIEVLPGLSEHEKARAILEELATDPGVLHVLDKHRWNVGALCELYPEGYVGVSDVCVMGLNQNKGQKILLRLRTDDLKGFRKILSIRKVLYHELAHMEHSEHDDQFYMLMREIEREVVAYNDSGRALGGATRYAFPASEGGAAVDGHRLGGTSTELQQIFSARELAGLAAQQRITEEERRIEEGCGCGGPAHIRAGDTQSPVIHLGERPREVIEVPATEGGAGDSDMIVVRDDDEEVGKGDGGGQEELPQHQSEEAGCSSHHHHSHHDGHCSEASSSAAGGEVVDVMDLQVGITSGEEAKGEGMRDDRIVAPASSSSSSSPPPQDGPLEQLLAMGFEMEHAHAALSTFGGAVDQAAEYLLIHDGRADGLITSATPGGDFSGLTGGESLVDPLSREGRVLDSVKRMNGSELGDRESRRIAMETILRMVKNMLDHPEEDKYRRVRLSNAKFHAAVGRHVACMDFLRALGFEEDGDILQCRRKDPGLLWLGRSALEQLCDAA